MEIHPKAFVIKRFFQIIGLIIIIGGMITIVVIVFINDSKRRHKEELENQKQLLTTDSIQRTETRRKEYKDSLEIEFYKKYLNEKQ